jgi:hypothetical protein
MPTFNSTIYTGQVGAAGASQVAASAFPLQRESEGKLRHTIVQYVLSTEATNDTIKLCRLRAGVKIIPQLCHIDCEDPGTALTLDIGDVTDTDRYLDGAALTTAHSAFFPALPSTTAVAAQRVPYAIEVANIDIIATVVLATVPTVGAKLCILIAWVEP